MRQPLQEARELAESAYGLRADVLRDLLQRCTSVKTVRLCLQARTRTPPALGSEAGPRATAHRQRESLGVPFGGWASGAQAMNQTYLDTARLLTQIVPVVFADGTFVKLIGI